MSMQGSGVVAAFLKPLIFLLFLSIIIPNHDLVNLD